MHLRRAIFAVVGAILLAPAIHPQDSVNTPGEEIPGTRSFYFGQLVGLRNAPRRISRTLRCLLFL
jgi:hypothetical protein